MSNIEYETLQIEGLLDAQDIMRECLKQQLAEYTFWRFLWYAVTGKYTCAEAKTQRIYRYLHSETDKLLRPYLLALNMEANQ